MTSPDRPRRRDGRGSRRWLAAAASLLALSCRGASPDLRDYLLAERPSPAATATHDLPPIRVKPLVARGFLDHVEIAWRQGDVLSGTYLYHRWSESPAEMVTRALMRALRDGGRFAQVEGTAPRPSAPLTLSGDLLGLHELTEADGSRPRGVAELEVTLEFEPREGGPAQHVVVGSRQVVDASDDSVDALVRAVSAAAAAAIDEVARAIEAAAATTK